MSKDIAINVKNISKIYEMYDKPIDRLKETLSFGRHNYHKDFYALQNVTFQVKKGETLGIIGRNGAGKSTLLKIITGVLESSKGSVEVNGKISSLLELGAGFNPEFTGIENIYLNGTVMGFSKEEMSEKLQAILDFADIGDFVYQPVKTYSSGMYVRLAFSVAINVEPDILIVDEALAVGDAKFQLKCFQKLDDIKKSGATILFVSHDIAQMRELCTRSILLEHGKQLFWGDPKEAACRYFDLIFPKSEEKNKQNEISAVDNTVRKSTMMVINSQDTKVLKIFPEQMKNKKSGFGNGGAHIEWMELYGTNGTNVFTGGENIRIRTKYVWEKELVKQVQDDNNLVSNIGLGIAVADKKGKYVFGCNNYDADVFVDYMVGNYNISELTFKMPYLQSETYFLTAAISIGKQEHHVQLWWYDYFFELKCISCKKNVYGFMALDYTIKTITD